MMSQQQEQQQHQQLIKLPYGNKRSVDLLNNLDRRKFIQLSHRIFDAMPIDETHSLFTEDERKKLISAFGLETSTDLNQLISTCVELWRQIAYHQPKPETLKANLHELGFVNDLTDVFVQVWTDRGGAVSDRLRGISFSGRPQLIDVNWTLRMDVASRDSPKMREPKVVLELLTDQGPKLAEMSPNELAELFKTLQQVQESIDNLMQ
ncbi:unnamed protein product [Anisakis simplex]|uniref:COMM domain-containing protein n=1 Tax=Anisakis simplex TaxID=6269 RepID=A0A0M3J1Z2_ANISI|nr:unnamed protein product [Anisakis simplex]